MARGAIRIGPEFFAGAFREYADWRWAIAREFAQNGIDCNSSAIHVTVEAGNDEYSDQITRLTVKNDGEPMTEDVLIDKLLTLGGSGKKFQNGAVGGFGQAKHLLYLCHKQYRIHTGHHQVTGSGADYDLTAVDYLHGTESSITVAGDHVATIINQFKRFATLAQWDGTLTINGEQLATNLRKGARRKDLPFGVIYTNKSFENLLVCRINGTPMFTKPIAYKGCVLIELSGTSVDTLTSNRDRLVYAAQSELDEFIVSISTNARKAFKEPKTVEKRVYPGYRLAGRAVHQAAARTDDEIGKEQCYVLAARIAATTENTKAADAPTITVARIQQLLHPEFRIRNELAGKIPEWYLPSAFSDNSRRLISNWVALLVEMADLTNCSAPFAVGFCFDDEARGLQEQEGGISTIYVNPISLVQKPGKPRQLKTYWSFSAAGNWELLALAVHEFCHHLTNEDHTETYANRLTDLFALVLQHRTRFSRHFSAPASWPG